MRPREKKEEERALAHWDPFRDLDRWMFGRLPERLWPAPFSSWFEDLMGERMLPARGVAAPLDISETDTQYVVTIELPGVSREDISIDVQDRVVSIRGEKKSEREEKKEKGHWLERTYGAFSRSFTLPTDAVEDRMEASFKDGVLKLVIERSERPKGRTIAVKG